VVSGAVLLGFLRGVAEKRGAKSWCFCGEFVVNDVRSLVLRHHDWRRLKFSSFLKFIFGVWRDGRTGEFCVGFGAGLALLESMYSDEVSLLWF
jgi:hypothetical protein